MGAWSRPWTHVRAKHSRQVWGELPPQAPTAASAGQSGGGGVHVALETAFPLPLTGRQVLSPRHIFLPSDAGILRCALPYLGKAGNPGFV